MPTNKELVAEVKKLKGVIRELKNELKEVAPKEENLPEETFFVLKENSDYFFYEIKVNPETKELKIIDKKKYKSRDKALVMHEARKRITCQVLEKKRENF